MKIKTLTGLLFIWIIFSLIFIQEINSVPEYEQEILKAFNKTSEVAIIVKLYSRNMTKVDEVLATLSEQEFKLEGKFPNGRGFYGNITKSGFDNLINNSNV